MSATIRNPVEWGIDQFRHVAEGFSATGHAIGHVPDTLHSPLPVVRRIGVDDLRYALNRGYDDLGACRSDVVFLCAFYPIVGFFLGRFFLGSGMIPLLFPLAAGFALVGPLAALGLLEISREREQGRPVTWATAFDVLHAPSIGAIALLGILLMAIFITWLYTAEGIYHLTIGPEQPASLPAFLATVFTTPRGWALVGLGVSVGFLFAVLVLLISVVSFALLIDREVGLDTAIRTSVRAVTANPGIMTLWSAIIVGSLIVGSIPLFIGLVVVMPFLGHATWHLYRRVVGY